MHFRSTILSKSSPAWPLVASYLPSLALLVSSPIIARLLGPQRRGELALILLVDGVSTAVLLFGTPQAVGYGVRHLGLQPDEVHSRLRAVMSTATALSFASAVGIFLIGTVFDTSTVATASSSLLVLSTPITVAARFWAQVSQAEGDYRPTVIVNGAPTVILAIVVSMIYITGSKLSLGIVVGVILAGRVGVWLVSRRRRFKRVTVSEAAAGLRNYGLRSWTITVGHIILLQFVQVFVYLYLGTESVGYYAVAAGFVSVLSPAAIAALNFLFFDKTRVNTPADRVRLAGYAWAGQLMLAVVLAFLAPTLVPALFGSEYLASVTPSIVLLIGAVFQAGFMAVRSQLDASGRVGWSAIAMGAGLASLFIAAPVLVPTFGLIGAAFSAVIGEAVRALTALLALFLYDKSIRRNPTVQGNSSTAYASSARSMRK